MSQLKGKLGTNGFYTQSVHDDLEEFIQTLRKGIVNEENVFTFCFPKLDENEMIKILNKNEDYLKTFYKYYLGENPDVPDNQMVLSESKSKFSMVVCSRHTFRLGKDNQRIIHHTRGNLYWSQIPPGTTHLVTSSVPPPLENAEEPEKSSCPFCFC